MKKLKLKIASRLKGRSGESIAEVLIALLIAALAMTMLVTAPVRRGISGSGFSCGWMNDDMMTRSLCGKDSRRGAAR